MPPMFFGSSRSLSEYAHCPLEAACSAEYFVALRSQRYGVAPSSRLVSSKHSAPNRSTCILRQAPSSKLLAASTLRQRAPVAFSSRSHLTVLKNTGHWIMEERPEETM